MPKCTQYLCKSNFILFLTETYTTRNSPMLPMWKSNFILYLALNPLPTLCRDKHEVLVRAIFEVSCSLKYGSIKKILSHKWESNFNLYLTETPHCRFFKRSLRWESNFKFSLTETYNFFISVPCFMCESNFNLFLTETHMSYKPACRKRERVISFYTWLKQLYVNN